MTTGTFEGCDRILGKWTNEPYFKLQEIETTTKHIAVYVRVSSKKQDHRSQLPDLKRWAEAQDAPVVWYRDKFTGKTQNRLGWKKLERSMRAGKVLKHVCWKLDRRGRTGRELLTLFDELRQPKVDLVCVVGGVMGLDTAEGRLMVGMVAQFAEYDNEIRSERIPAGQAIARANGKRWRGSAKGKRKKVTPTQEKAIRCMKAVPHRCQVGTVCIGQQYEAAAILSRFASIATLCRATCPSSCHRQ